MTLCIYANEAGRSILRAEQEKIFLIGGDFGYGNFGDILQHVNAVRMANQSGRFATVSVLAANAIGSKDFPEWATQAYGSDAVVFVAGQPLMLHGDSPSLEIVREIRNLSAVWLYGGGFLNEMWGEFVLGVSEHFLRLNPGAAYLVSGQQVTSPFQAHVANHVRTFAPKVFGVRDELSAEWLRCAGFDPDFSFDDATEALLSLSEQIPLRPGPGMMIHLNSSGYTANAALRGGLGDDLARLQSEAGAREGVTLLQAFRDSRSEVQDSRETVKRLDAYFPFNDFRAVELAALAYATSEVRLTGGLSGRMGYSCSYHVALWLQLAGIPCWLRSSNPFYSQKSRALQVSQDLESFLREPGLADHRANLERRAGWRDRFARTLETLPDNGGVSISPADFNRSEAKPFIYKDSPSMEEGLDQARRDADLARVDLTKARQELDFVRERLDAVDEQLRQMRYEAQAQRERADAACLQLESVLTSKSWRLTSPLRGLRRVFQGRRVNNESRSDPHD